MPLIVADNYGPEQRLLNDRFCAATGIRRTDYVLDACMAPGGRTSRDAARAAMPDKVLGADVSEQLVERGRMGLPPVPFAAPTSLRQRCAAKVCYLASM